MGPSKLGMWEEAAQSRGQLMDMQSFRGSSVLRQQGKAKAAGKGDKIKVELEKIRCRFSSRHQQWIGAEWPGVGPDQQNPKG